MLDEVSKTWGELELPKNSQQFFPSSVLNSLSPRQTRNILCKLEIVVE